MLGRVPRIRLGAKWVAPGSQGGSPHLDRRGVSSKVMAAVSYEEMRRDCPTTFPPSFNFALDVLDRHADHPNTKKSVALHHVDARDRVATKWTYQDLSRETKKCATALRSLGQSQRMVVMLPHMPEWWMVMLASLRNDTVTIPTTKLLDVPALRRRLLRYPQ